MSKNRVQLIGKGAILIMALLFITLAVSPQAVSAQESDTDRAPRMEINVQTLETIAELIGIETRALFSELREGSSIAEIAQANNVAPQTIIDEFVARAQTRLDEAVEAGNISEDEAAERIAGLAERFAQVVNATNLRVAQDDRDDRERPNDGDPATVTIIVEPGQELTIDLTGEGQGDECAAAFQGAQAVMGIAVEMEYLTREQVGEILSAFRERLAQRCE